MSRLPGLRSALRILLAAAEDAPFPGANKIIPRTIRGVGEYPDITTYESPFTIPANTEARTIARNMRRKLINTEPGRRRSEFSPAELRSQLERMGITRPKGKKRISDMSDDELVDELSQTNLMDAWIAGDDYATRNYAPYEFETSGQTPNGSRIWDRLKPIDRAQLVNRNKYAPIVVGVRKSAINLDPKPLQRLKHYVAPHKPGDPDRVNASDLDHSMVNIIAQRYGQNPDYSLDEIANAFGDALYRHSGIDVPHLLEIVSPHKVGSTRMIAFGNRFGTDNPLVKYSTAKRGNLVGQTTQPLDPEVNIPIRGGGYLKHDPYHYILPILAALLGAQGGRSLEES